MNIKQTTDLHPCVEKRLQLFLWVDVDGEYGFTGDVGKRQLILAILGLDGSLAEKGDKQLKETKTRECNLFIHFD